MATAYVEVPSGWRREASRGFGPFVTREVFRLPDGSRLLWDSRWHRKHAGRVPGGSTWWAPFALDWWMGLLFAVGSVCFALGSFPPYATAVGATPDDITFFIGSIFFTTASFLQYTEVASSPTDIAEPHRNGLASLLRIRHRRIDWWAAVIQLVGTVWFNRTTLSALLVGLGASPDHHPIWRPDALGSICFLVSSWLAWVEECHGPFVWRPAAISWWITMLNLVGSIAFGVSAVASYVTSSGQLLSLALTNLGTFVGAVCFLVGAILLLPERTLESPGTLASDGAALQSGLRAGRAQSRPQRRVMLKKLGSPDTVLAVEVVGKLEKDDYRTVLVPGLDELLERHGEIRCVMVFGDEYAGLTAGGTVEDSKLYFSELVHRDFSKWRRCAVATGHGWLRHALAVFQFMMPGEIECFEPSQVQAAIDWAAA